MPYLTQSRPYTSTRHGRNDRVAKWEWYENGTQLPWISGAGSGTSVATNCMEDTYSFRDGPSVLAVQPVMTGPEMKDAILRGDELSIDPRAPGGIYRTGEHVRLDGVLNSTYDQGHEFRTFKLRRELPTFDVTGTVLGNSLRFYGHPSIVPSVSNPWPSLVFATTTSEKGQMYAHGNRAISESAPTAPEAGLAAMVAELSRLPTLPLLNWIRKGPSAHQLGSEYLNVQFGIKPLLSDIRALAHAVSNSREIVEQFIRDADKPIRRKRTLVDERVVTKIVSEREQVNVNTFAPARNPEIYGREPLWPRTQYGMILDKTVENVWFSGAFSYFLYESETLLGRLQSYEAYAQKLLGVRLDADVLWELTPWSWLIDWFFDVQSFITRHSRLASDNLVLRYGYVMRSQTAERTVMLANIIAHSGRVIPTPQMTYSAYKAERLRSTPYGFGFDVGAMSAQRWAILAALGLTKGPRTLRP